MPLCPHIFSPIFTILAMPSRMSIRLHYYSKYCSLSPILYFNDTSCPLNVLFSCDILPLSKAHFRTLIETALFVFNHLSYICCYLIILS